MNKSHICFFIGTISNKGGTERMTISLANYLVDQSYKVSIISLFAANNIFFNLDNRISVYSILTSSNNMILKYPYMMFSLYRIINKKKIDIIVDVDVILSLFTLPLKIFDKKLKIVSWEHFNYKANLGVSRRDYARKYAKQYADAIVTLTNQDREFYLEDGKAKIPVITISNFLQKFPEKKSELNNKTVLAVGRFNYQKGFDILVNVWSKVKKESSADGWILQIIGDGEDKDKIKQQILNLGLQSSIIIIDAQENISAYYLQASIYLMTSRFEGLPMVLLEAKAHGLPIISFDCLTGPKDIVRNNIDGFLIDFKDEKLMVDNILTIMNNEKLRKEMGRKARIYSKAYTKEVVVEKWISLLNSL